ncbi:actin filament-associated protein 1-like 1 [Chiloscyllium plagiosum]|uniref:actin filament-associated protein 1-like 1 n=1 Tax=Chiloscyllium plagiosum TaxID=36176 RepID=UPI001CB87EEC|nr:actin filament-associated protein 1-like 1 [Chiloscyllium plagiosum]
MGQTAQPMCCAADSEDTMELFVSHFSSCFPNHCEEDVQQRGDRSHPITWNFTDLDQLFSELQSFLKVLDTECLSCVAESKKESVAELLQELNTSPCAEQTGSMAAEDADYMFMSCVTLAENRLDMQLPTSASKLRNVLEIIEDTEDVSPCPQLLDDFQTKVMQSTPPPAPHQTNEVHPDDSYEDAEPLNPLTQCTAGVSRGLERLISSPFLQCYKCMKDQYPLMELSLQGSRVTYKFKRSKKIQHELKITTASNETLVLGLQSREQTEDWRKVVEEVSSMSSRTSSWNSSQTPGTDSQCVASKSALRGSRGSELERPPGEVLADNPATRDTGYLKVLVNSHWQTLWCHIEDRVLLMYKDVGGAGRLHYSVDLQGCEVRMQADSTHKYRLTVSQQHKDLAVLQTSSPEDRDRWLSLLQAGCGMNTEPAHLYEDTVLPSGTDVAPRDGNQVSGLLQRRITTPNTYMDDPFGQVSGQNALEDRSSGATQQTRVNWPSREVVNREGATFQDREHCSSTNNNNPARYSTLPSVFRETNFLKSWSDFEIKTCGAEKEPFRNQATQTDKKDFKEAMDILSEKKALPRLEEKIRRLEQAMYRAKERVKSGSELNLLSLSKTLKRASCGQSLALFSSNSEAASPEGPIVSPILRRTASAKSTLRRTPSITVVEKGRVLQKTKEWEMKSSV